MKRSREAELFDEPETKRAMAPQLIPDDEKDEVKNRKRKHTEQQEDETKEKSAKKSGQKTTFPHGNYLRYYGFHP